MPKDKNNPPPGSIPVRTSAVCAYIFRRGADGPQFLVLKRQSQYMFGLWQQVGGKVESGEKGTTAILREIKEETGVIPQSLYSVDIVESFYDINHGNIHIIPVFVAEFAPTAEVVLSNEHSEYKWVSLAEAKELLVFTQQRASLDIIDREFIRKEPPPQLKVEF
ncbi:MAG TPA: NUDIX hydrolase [candidate division Zixibacteria bacterium]|jgi:dihydroneopterin triphosphate diphosphatase|nr:NUDIX hydrolase [candidate division Zixibacteria bacterium]HBZ00629.1 NUDIX hydrolase [candidate division Zixibacteria bacterium]